MKTVAVVLIMAFVATFACTACLAGGFTQKINHKYQIDCRGRTCKADGHPNFLLINGQKFPNPVGDYHYDNGKIVYHRTWAGSIECIQPNKEWCPIKTGCYICYDPEKPENYGCAYIN